MVSVSGSGRVRTNMSVPHLLGAATFRRELHRLEQAHCGEVIGRFFEEVLAFASAGVYLSIASVEAYANELLIDLGQHVPSLSEEDRHRHWTDLDRRSILAKFDGFVVLAGGTPIDHGDAVAENLDALIMLRNALTHFRADWDNLGESHRKVSAKLEGRFTGSPFLTDPDELFPKRWASEDAVRWAIESVRNYATEISKRVSVSDRYQQFADRIDA